MPAARLGPGVRWIGAALAALLLAHVPPAAGQASAVTLGGIVRTREGGPPLEASIELRNRETGAVRTARAGVDGVYRLHGLSPGSYDLAVRADGYWPQQWQGLRLVHGEPAVVDVTLRRAVGELEPAVIIAGRTTPTVRTDISTAVLSEEIERLPMNARNVLSLAALAPGVRSFAPEAGRSIPAAGAMSSPRLVNLQVDGVEWKGLATGAIVGQPQSGSLLPQDAIREFRVHLNPYDAELTRGASWIISAVTHSGGNTREGSLFVFHQDRNLIARRAFQRARPDYTRRQVGGSVRGPLVRDRLFFAASYEGQVTDEYVDVVPPRPTADPEHWSAHRGSFRTPYRNHMGVLKLTAPLGAHTLDATWTTRALTAESGFGITLSQVYLTRDAGLTSSFRVNAFQLRDVWSSTRGTNELSMSVLDQRSDERPLVPGPTLRYPTVQVRGRTTFPSRADERHVRIANKTALSFGGPLGGHTLKVGAELVRVAGTGYQPNFADGIFHFATDTSTAPMTAQIGVGYLNPGSTADARASIDGWLAALYVQDEWRPLRRLLVTAGVRWDAELGTLNQDEHAPWATDTALLRVVGARYLNAGDRTADLDNVAPRLAAAWDVTGGNTTSLRAGFGVMYDRVPVYGAFFEKIAWRWRTYTIRAPGTTDPAVLRDSVAKNPDAARPNIVLLPDRLETPHNRQWSAGLSRRFGRSVTIDIDYVDQHLRNAPVTVVLNQAPNNTPRPLTQRYGAISLWGDFGDATWRGVLTSLRVDRGADRLSIAYTRGRARSEFSALTTSDFPDSADYVMQQSDGDERHRVVLSGFTILPLAIQLSAIATIASPRPIAVSLGTDANGNGTAVDDWPEGVRTRRPGGWEHWYRTVDLRLARSFGSAKRRLTATVDLFNALNTVNYAEYQGNVAALGWMNPVGAYARRQAQAGLRYQF